MVRFVLSLFALSLAAAPAAARDILFVGNSFTFGAGSPVERYRPDSVTDLNGEGIGGVPALFRAFAEQSGLDWTVSLETSPGKDLAFHYARKRAAIDRRWDVVILQGYSTLDAERPGDATRHGEAAGRLAALVRARNPQASVKLVETWSRADLTYRPGSRWSGRPIVAMAQDLADANRQVARTTPGIAGTIPVGSAWNRAIARRVADANPYDGIDPGKLGLWADDHYHGSSAGYYLQALTIFGSVTGYDVRRLGTGERAAADLGLTGDQAVALQRIAWKTLRAHR
ncbi:SGNH/GDSL hydrolase family protein [Sphingomonas sp. 2R-10]|uniref:SGNH/GDSL hydrolase family protein n=1 Tax=Sphingomonas sp. 2R-10 TaxID=3045148 RepID=UPI000F789C92|nr:SGNH/GDSL hydrolase family protein [Sphingomonas sp. 2R-10]MDJ0275254.1 SGNH/GDSL hydrolase family protein [Sphingomonas sp. 2R-10]